MNERVNWVYRAFDADGRCLYVGVTKNIRNRKAQHRIGSAWYRFAVHYRLTGPLDRPSALELERAEIGELRPIYNERMRVVTQDGTYWRAEMRTRLDAWKADHPDSHFQQFLGVYQALEEQIRAESGIDLDAAA